MNSFNGVRIRRCAAACYPCHQRKIKCDAVLRGTPCSACITSGEIGLCTLRPSQRIRRTNGKGHQKSNQSTSSTALEAIGGTLHLPSGDISCSISSDDGPILRRGSPLHASKICDDTTPQTVLHQGNTTQSGDSATPVHIEFSPDSNFQVNLVLKDPSGIPKGWNFTIFGEPRPQLQEEDLVYLQAKGAFSIPPVSVCDELVKCYFLHVHFCYPIINAGEFLAGYVNGGPTNVQFMLLWAVFLAAADYVDSSVVTRAGFNCRPQMRELCFIRSKLLYEMNAFEDKETCAQVAAIFSSFMPSPHKDMHNVWIYSTAARHICQLLIEGVRIRQERLGGPPTSHKMSLWKRILWACNGADTGRVLNTGWRSGIDLMSCPVPELEASDVLNDFHELPILVQQEFVPLHVDRLVQYYLFGQKLSSFVTSFLAKARRTHDDMHLTDEIGDWEAQIREMEAQMRDAIAQDLESEDVGAQSAAYHCKICIAGVRVVVLRLYLALTTPSFASEQRHLSWQCGGESRAISAATEFLTCLEEVISRNLINYLRKSIMSLFWPVLHIFLAVYTSKNGTERRLAHQRLETCKIILEEVQKTNWRAEITLKFLKSAMEKITENEQPGSIVDQEPELLGTANLSGDPVFHHQPQFHGYDPLLYDDLFSINTTTALSYQQLMSGLGNGNPVHGRQ